MSPEVAAAYKSLLEAMERAEPDAQPFEGAVGPVYVVDKGIRVERREVDFVASTPDMDSQGDIVEQDFVFERFLKNPVILFAHDSRSLPIGRAENIRVQDGVLKLTVVFASKQANPLAENVFLLLKEKVLRAMSIGFIPRDIRREMREGEEVWVLSRNELIEASVVPIPANENALAELKAKALQMIPPTPPLERDNPADGGKRGNMNLEQVQKELAELKSAKDALSKELEVLMERYKALEGLYKDEKERANKAELANVERDVDALIGTKISAKEKASLIKLAGVNRGLYEEQMAAISDRPDMNLCKGSVLPDEKPEPRALPTSDGNSGADFASLVLRRAGMNS